MKKICLLVIIGILFCKNCPFLDNFHKNLFLVYIFQVLPKICPKTNFKLNFGHIIVKTQNNYTKNKFLSKLSKNRQFLLNKIPKMTNKQIFFIKGQMLPICDFYNTFSISASFDLLQVSPDIQVPQVPENGRVRWRMA